jgi:DNA-binding LacI/PurR family transcriptional regulator
VLLLLPEQNDSSYPFHPDELLRGCRTAIADSTHPIRLQTLHSEYDDPTFEARVMETLKSPDRPDAIFAHADFRAAQAIPMIQSLGLSVPQDIAVLGYYDTPWTMVTHPRLSSISTRPAEIVSAVADMFLNDRMGDQIVIPPRLMIRASTRG